MSDWEDYCESNGWNIGSADDYDRFLRSLEDKTVVPAKTTDASKVFHEYESDVTIEELIADINDCSLGDNANEFSCEPWGWELGYDGELCYKFLSGITLDYPELHRFTVRVQTTIRGEYYVSLRLFLEALRAVEIPVLVYNDILAWNAKTQSISVSGNPAYYLHGSAPKTSDQLEESSKLVHFLERSKWTDHGFKPVIIPRNDIDSLNRGEQVTFLDPNNMAVDELMQCGLAYFSKRGQPKWIPMDYVLSESTLLVTRTGNYLVKEKHVEPATDIATLMSGAYFLAKKQRPFGGRSNMRTSYFLKKKRGTIFEPAFQTINEMDAGSHPADLVYITDGSHPLVAGLCDPSFITTYAHYDTAREKLKDYWATH